MSIDYRKLIEFKPPKKRRYSKIGSESQIISMNPFEDTELARRIIRELQYDDEIPDELEKLFTINPSLVRKAAYGKTSLLGYAVIARNYLASISLMRYGADPTWAPDPKWAPIELIFKNEFIEVDILMAMLEFMDEAFNENTYRILSETLKIDENHARMIHNLLRDKTLETLYSKTQDYLDKYLRTPLMYASIMGNSMLVPYFIGLGYGPNDRDMYGWTPLHYSIYWTIPAIINNLLNMGADVNALTNENQTPLHLAAMKGDHEGTELLLSWGADPNLEDIRGNTPLIEAIISTNHILIEMLLQNGADPNGGPSRKKLPLTVAIEIDRKHNTKYLNTRLLMEYGANPYIKDIDGNSPADLAKEDKKLRRALEL